MNLSGIKVVPAENHVRPTYAAVRVLRQTPKKDYHKEAK